MTSCGVFFPFIIMENLADVCVDRWMKFYKNPLISSRDNCCEEGLWRRTQNRKNKEQSGWSQKSDMRRRMVHYQYKYDLADGINSDKPSLVMTEFYLWWHVCMPDVEISVYLEHIYSNLQFCGWTRICKLGDYEHLFRYRDLYVRVFKSEPKNNFHDQLASRSFPRNYSMLEATMFSVENCKDEEFLAKPWKILDTGIRVKDNRGKPLVDYWERLHDLFPAQIELGCGPSIEAGVPPLHFLHDVYRVTDVDTDQFVLDPYKDRLIGDIISCPGGYLTSLSEMYRKCFMAQPTNFYRMIRELYDRGLVVGPIITNNFDGLSNRMGLKELFVRRYDEAHVIPEIQFHPLAKSLIVVGSHADRRRIQCAARNQGLQVVYVDPEGYCDGDEFTEYPLEAPHDDDILFRVTATEFAKKIRDNIL